MSDRPDAAASDDGITASWSSQAAAWSIMAHGGAGDVHPSSLKAHVGGCERAAEAGAAVLAAGGTALDAVQRAVEVLESDPLFNAGTGACLDSDGHIALDASIMDGSALRAGAVCAMPAFEHPVAIARRVMEDTMHVMLAGEGAARFATSRGFVAADEASMITPIAWKRWAAARAKNTAVSWAGSESSDQDDPGSSSSGGTVGAVARDGSGHVAAATSTGGMINKLAGRVGDSPIIGAGTYADDEAGACSTTGHGEAMIRICLAKTAVDGMRSGRSAEQTTRESIALMLRRTSLTGGLIAVAADGSLGLARTTRTMTWASVRASSASTEGGSATGSQVTADAACASGA